MYKIHIFFQSFSSAKMRKFQDQYIWLFILLYMPYISAVKPVFDYSNNMRLVLLPADTKLNSVIYRLRASDADEHYPLQFTAYGMYFQSLHKCTERTIRFLCIQSLIDDFLYHL